MEENQYPENCYPIPTTLHARYSKSMHLLCLFVCVCFASFIIFLPNDDTNLLWIKAGAALIVIFFAYNWIYANVLKRIYLLLNEQFIEFRTAFGTKCVPWDNFLYAETYYSNNQSFIGLVSKDNLKKRNLLQRFFTSQYKISFSLKLFSDADEEELFATISYMILNARHQGEDALPSVEAEPAESFPAEAKRKMNALLQSFLLFLAVLILNYFSTYVLENPFILPVLGVAFIPLPYFNSRDSAKAPVAVRVLIGLFCSLPLLLAPLFSVVAYTLQYESIDYFSYAIQYRITQMLSYPEEYGIYWAVSAILFLCGSLYNTNFRFIRILKGKFKKKRNGFTIEKIGRYTNVYLVDYANYRENETKQIIEVLPGSCLVERSGKDFSAVYIPSALFADAHIRADMLQRVQIDDNNYFMLNLGGKGKPEAYGFSITIIMNHDDQAEVIRLELGK